LGIELGQMLLPGKFPDTTDWFLESLGGCLGYIVFKWIRGAPPQRQRLRPISSRSSAARR
jgi:glycopeptide antibiotics resistance protein